MSAPKTGRRYCTFAHLSVNSSTTAVLYCHTLDRRCVGVFFLCCPGSFASCCCFGSTSLCFFNKRLSVLVAFSQDNFSLFRFLHTLLSLQIFKNKVRHMKRGRNKHCGEWQKNHPFLSVWFWKWCFPGHGRGENWKQTHPPWRAGLVLEKYRSAKNEETHNNSPSLIGTPLSSPPK